MKEGLFFEKGDSGRIHCALCPHGCVLDEGQTGLCQVRQNRKGKGVSLNYGSLSAVHIDPVEKKPLYHFKPGTDILSLGSYGCNLSCRYCQNHPIARDRDRFAFAGEDEIITPSLILEKLEGDLSGVAYTYNEPIVWYEFVVECARSVKDKGYANVMVTNGFIEPEPLKELFPLIDAFSVDLKAFSGDFYRSICGGRLTPVKRSLEAIARSGCHLEVDYLVVPELNDGESDFDEMLRWYVQELGPQVPLHINRYHPQYKLSQPATPVPTLVRLDEKARDYLDYVYIGNAQADRGGDTLCPSCGHRVIERRGYETVIWGDEALSRDSVCPRCGHLLNIIF
ncbi:MAG: AmmeMemoRadiSam system radical SAM enzyme [Spirochaetales bacterium]|nr:AmmeMemoRadiSam system radical SAM enzyme [Spirochaetales bacterium]